MTLTEFLLARIAEDEEMARVVHVGRWNSRVALLEPDLYGHVARQHPARVLAECKAKRRIILQQQESERSAEGDEGGAWAAGMAYAGGLAMRDLAATYADHSDYREEWKP